MFAGVGSGFRGEELGATHGFTATAFTPVTGSTTSGRAHLSVDMAYASMPEAAVCGPWIPAGDGFCASAFTADI